MLPASETATSIESADTRATQIKPRPSPRQLRKLSSIHTDSVSSYSPSDENDGSDAYSDEFDEESESNEQAGPIKQMNELSLDPRAKMGYTWT